MKIIITENKLYSIINKFISEDYPNFKLVTSDNGDKQFCDEFGSTIIYFEGKEKYVVLNEDLINSIDNMFNLDSKTEYFDFFKKFLDVPYIDEFFIDPVISVVGIPSSFSDLILETLERNFDKIQNEKCNKETYYSLREWRECFAYQLTSYFSKGQKGYYLENSLFWTMFQNILYSNEFFQFPEFANRWRNPRDPDNF
jgi:hypothetical protein